MRVLFIHSGADLYGASRSLLRLSSRLVREGHEVLIVLPCDGPLRAVLLENGSKVIIHRNLPVVSRQKFRSLFGIFSLGCGFIFSFFQLFSLVNRYKPDLIHTNSAVILSPGVVARITGVPHIWHIRETFIDFPQFWKFYQYYIVFFSNVIICVSTPVAEQFQSKLRERKVRVVHNGFPKSEFEEVSSARIEAFRNKFGLQSYERAIGVVGRIKFLRKGQDIFAQSAALLKDHFPESKFLCIGSPFPGNEDHLERLLDLIQKLGLSDTVIYTGDVDDPKAAMASLDIVVLSSGQPEPFGGVVVEAMALGKPVVGTRIGGTVEQIEDGVTGLLIDPGDPAAMANALATLLHDQMLCDQMGKKGRERFMQYFEFEAFYQEIMNIYRSNLKNG